MTTLPFRKLNENLTEFSVKAIHLGILKLFYLLKEFQWNCKPIAWRCPSDATTNSQINLMVSVVVFCQKQSDWLENSWRFAKRFVDGFGEQVGSKIKTQRQLKLSIKFEPNNAGNNVNKVFQKIRILRGSDLKTLKFRKHISSSS